MLQLAITAMLFCFCLMLIYGALSDLTRFTIPNWVSYGLVLLFAAHTFVVWLNTPYFVPGLLPSLSFHLPPWTWNVFTGLFVLVISVIFWKLRYIGGGDVKFLSATALWMGIKNGAPFMILVTVMALVLIFALKFLRLWNPRFQSSPRVPLFFKQLLERAGAREIPYGLPVAVAALFFAPGMFAA